MLTISHLLHIHTIQEEVEEAEVDTSSDDDDDGDSTTSSNSSSSEEVFIILFKKDQHKGKGQKDQRHHAQ